MMLGWIMILESVLDMNNNTCAQYWEYDSTQIMDIKRIFPICLRPWNIINIYHGHETDPHGWNDGKLLKALQCTIWVLQTNQQTWNQRRIVLAQYPVPWNAIKELSNVIANAFEGNILDEVGIILSSRAIYTTKVDVVDHPNQPWLQFFTFTFVLCKSLWLVFEIANLSLV